jgi:hypothetical protein
MVVGRIRISLLRQVNSHRVRHSVRNRYNKKSAQYRNKRLSSGMQANDQADGRDDTTRGAKENAGTRTFIAEDSFHWYPYIAISS